MPDAPNIAERAVERFEAARQELLNFLRDPEIREVMKEYEQLVDGYNQSLDDATRAVKSHLRTIDGNKYSVGVIGAQKKYKRWYDAEFLANSLPAEQAELVLTETVTYTVDTEVLDQMARQGEVDNALIQAAFHEEEQNPALLPGTPKAYNIPAIPLDD